VNASNEIHGLRSLLRAKDKEIERLQDQIKALQLSRDTVTQSIQRELDQYKSLHTELANVVRHAVKPKPATARPGGFDRTRTCFVELGRYGDIINVLPICRDVFHSTGHRPVVVVAEAFAPLFDGVGYADPLPMALETVDIQPAIKEARTKFDKVIVSQVYARGWHPSKLTPAYNVESWRLAGYLDRWADASMKLVFDRRDYRRERALISKVWPEADKPVVLINGVGHSSPFAGRAAFQARVFERWQDEVAFVDLGDIQAERIFDLVGLMELADGVVTTDTATLHLAAATLTPTVALLSDGGGWKQTSPRCNCVLKFTAGEWQSNVDAFDAAMMDWIVAYRTRKVVHTFERHPTKDPRIARAQATWGRDGWVLAPYEKYARNARSEIGDPRELPYLRDVLAHGLRVAGPRDYLVFTNDDNGLADTADAEVRRVLGRAVMATGRRSAPEDPGHIGRDLLAFRADWLRNNIELVPDFILGAPEWDLWAAAQARKLAGLTWTTETSAVDAPMCEVAIGTVLHEAHAAHWSGHQQEPASLHNKLLCGSENA